MLVDDLSLFTLEPCPAPLIRGYEDVKTLAHERHQRVDDLLALARGNDPFYAGQPAQRALAEWFADLWQTYSPFLPSPYVRRLHYYMVSLAERPRKPGGMPYENTKRDWDLLSDASKYARYLGFVPADLLVDHRNPEAVVPEGFGDSRPDPALWWNDLLFGEWRLPTLPTLGLNARLRMEEPLISGYDYHDLDQPYHIEVWIEKSTMEDVLDPLAAELCFVVSQAIGFTSVTRTIEALQRVARVHKPTRIFYISDYDPAGSFMPPSAARQLEFWLSTYVPGGDIKLTPLVLTAAQVATYTLPRIPIKESDKRRAGFEQRYGEGGVELDALEAIYPGELARIVREAIAPYRDPDLADAYDQRRREAARMVRVAWQTATADLRSALVTLEANVQAVVASFEEEYADFQRRFGLALAPYEPELERLTRLYRHTRRDFRPELPPVPTSDLPPPDESAWLFDSQRDYLTQLVFYKGEVPPSADADTQDDAEA